MRICEGLPSLRALWSVVLAAITAGNLRDDFRIVLFAVMSNHIHMIIEANNGDAMSKGMTGLNTRLARAINKAAGSTDQVFATRYDAKELKNPTMVRRAIVYVLHNIKKHAPQLAPLLDPCSSARWFPYFKEFVPASILPSPVRAPRTWLARVGWLKAGGPISIHEQPGVPPVSWTPEKAQRWRQEGCSDATSPQKVR